MYQDWDKKLREYHTQIEDDDQCFTCEYFCKGVMCPLLEALAVGIARLTDEHDSVAVKNCGFYVAFERKLSVVKKKDSPK